MEMNIITEDIITNVNFDVIIIWNSCHYCWNSTIKNHINGKSRCTYCSDNVPWNYERFLEKARNIHGDKYNYAKVTHDHIQKAQSEVSLICNKCFYE
jgi:hypothetical protein